MRNWLKRVEISVEMKRCSSSKAEVEWCVAGEDRENQP